MHLASSRQTMSEIVGSVERRFSERGATPEGLYWPNGADLAERYHAALAPLLPVPGGAPLRLLDFGCGAAFLADWLDANGLLPRVDYTGLDASPAILDVAQQRWPALAFRHADLLAEPTPPLSGARFDAVIACGIFTVKFGSSQEAMIGYVQETLRRLWAMTEGCLVFNLITKHVDWEREDLFHWGLDEVARFCKSDLSRHLDIAGGYGLWEHSFHVWRAPRRSGSVVPAAWG
jgi:SAM-dependent methyltransferase